LAKATAHCWNHSPINYMFMQYIEKAHPVKEKKSMNHKLKYDYLVVEGNIGSGKTSLATKLSEDFQTKLVLERFADNPFLPLFYEQPVRYAFPLELSFLADRYQQLNDEVASQDLFKQQTVSDYMLSKSLIFANITLKDDENKLYQRLFHIINPHLPKPDLLIFLHKDIDQLMKNIALRGRAYEKNIKEDYLRQLDAGYWEFLKQLKGTRVVVVDTTQIDFVKKEKDYEALVSLIQSDFEPGIHRVVL
jgi:deoxyadenosine/deoxycytidine kinase